MARLETLHRAGPRTQRYRLGVHPHPDAEQDTLADLGVGLLPPFRSSGLLRNLPDLTATSSADRLSPRVDATRSRQPTNADQYHAVHVADHHGHR
jgi:hypothetical protein